MQSPERGNEKYEIKLGQARNSPLNISTCFPPEILGNIFYWTLNPAQAPHNLLFVCRHWFEVALQTPQLWTSWGDKLADWERRHTSPAASELNLKLTGGYNTHYTSPSKPLQATLQHRAAQDFIRRVSFREQHSHLLNFIIPSITTQGEGIQSISLESFKLYTKRHCDQTVHLTDFFSRSRFPKLQRLLLSGRFELLSWDLLASRTGGIVDLSLSVRSGWPIPSASQLLSILSSNPNLQRFELYDKVFPSFDNDDCSFQVELPHLKWIDLAGGSRDVFKLLNRIRPADKLDFLQLQLSYHSTSDISQTFKRFLPDHLLRRGDLEKGVGVGGACVEGVYSLWVADVELGSYSSKDVERFIKVSLLMRKGEGPQEEEDCAKLFFDSLAHIHRNIIFYNSSLSPLRSTDVSIGMVNLVKIRVPRSVPLSEWFVDPDPGGTFSYGQILPSLKYLSFYQLELDGGNWTPLTNFLSRRASVGNRLESLEITPNCPHVCPDVAEEIKRLVQHFEFYPWPVPPCPHGRCPAPV